MAKIYLTGIMILAFAGVIFMMLFSSYIIPQTFYQFYKAGILGFCTAVTYIPYTTNVLDAIDTTPNIQNQYYTTAVSGSCPYTIIYRATDETVNNYEINSKNYYQ